MLSMQVFSKLSLILVFLVFFFFFQAEDGIRDTSVTGVQTCALPISSEAEGRADEVGVDAMTRAVFLDRDGVLNHAVLRDGKPHPPADEASMTIKIGRASCREREESSADDRHFKRKRARWMGDLHDVT